jgi:hypothetical protein
VHWLRASEAVGKPVPRIFEKPGAGTSVPTVKSRSSYNPKITKPSMSFLMGEAHLRSPVPSARQEGTGASALARPL